MSLSALALLGSSVAVRVPDVRDAVFCLTHGRDAMLSGHLGRTIRVYASRDDRAFEGERRLLLFVLRKDGRYDAFDFAVSGRVYDVRNNATMRLRHGGVSYSGELLGGLWAHAYVERNFRRALRRPPLLVAVGPPPAVRPVCRRYDRH